MKKLCFGSLATVLVRCKAPTTTKKQLVGTMLLSVNKRYDIRTDDGTTSALARGHVNLSGDVTVYAKEAEPKNVAKYFREQVLPLLDLNRRETIVLALKNIIAEDTDILEECKIELVNKRTKAEIIAENTFIFEELLAGLFLYAAIYTANNKREENVREITDTYIKDFDAHRNELSFIASSCSLSDGSTGSENQSKVDQWPTNDTVIWKCGANTAEVITGDLFRYGFGNRKTDHKNIVVIPVNTAFDTQVTRNIEGNPTPRVSENTIHGQWLNRMKRCGTDMEELDARIAASLQRLGCRSVRTVEKASGKQEQYEIGACAVIDTDNAVYVLVAISEFNETNNARSTSENISKAMKSLLEVYNKVGQGYDMYMPVMGTGRSRTGMTMAEAYEVLKAAIINNCELIQGHLYLVIKPES